MINSFIRTLVAVSTLGSPLLCSASQLTISTQTGYEIPGFTNDGFGNSDYQRKSKENGLEVFQSITSNRNITRNMTGANTSHVIVEDKKFFPGVLDITSVVVKDSKIVSQLNCIQFGTGDIRCNAVTPEVCSKVLAASGKASLTELENSVTSCEKMLNVYNEAIKDPWVNTSIRDAYELHNNALANTKPSFLNSTHKFMFGTNMTPLGSAGSVKQSVDYRIYGLINSCKQYLADKSFASPKTATSSPTTGKGASNPSVK